MAKKFLSIRNWARYQHYKNRNPLWFKFYGEMMTSIDWVASNDASRVLMVALMTLAAKTGNRIPADPAYIKRVCYINGKVDFSQLLELQFIEYIDDSQLASTFEDSASNFLEPASPEIDRELEEEIEKSREEEPLAATQPVLIDAEVVDKQVKRAWDYYVKKFKRTERYQLTTMRKAKGTSRFMDCVKLARGQPEEAALLMKKAIDALAGSEFHRDNGHIDWIDNLFKSTEKLQWWLDKKQQVKANGKAEQRNSEIENARGEAAGLLGLRRNGSEVLPDNPRSSAVSNGRKGLSEGEPHPRVLDGGIRVIPRPERQPVSTEARTTDSSGEESGS